MSRTETMGLPKSGMLKSSSSCNRLMDRSESLKRDSTGGATKVRGSLERKKSKSFKEGESFPSWLITEAPGSIAAVRREQVAAQQALRKLKIAHYGRSKSTLTSFNSSKVVPLVHPNTNPLPQRCSFLTPTSDPVYVAYHDEEWGVPVHDDKMLFELLTLSGAQVGSDWTSTLIKRHNYRKAFMEFEAEAVAKLTEKEMNTISNEYKIEMSKVRGIVENATKIVEIKKVFESLEKYVWGFVNHKPISTNYKLGHKIPVKTSKSESISKDMVRRGFRFVGPTVVHSFMQAAGLTNDHLVTCYRHVACTLLTTTTTNP